jgi:hypothetical protein
MTASAVMRVAATDTNGGDVSVAAVRDNQSGRQPAMSTVKFGQSTGFPRDDMVADSA